jgi:hypothetical protein
MALGWPRLPLVSGYKFITATCNGHSTTEKIARSGVTAMLRPWLLARGNGFLFWFQNAGLVLFQFYKYKASNLGHWFMHVHVRSNVRDLDRAWAPQAFYMCL